MSRVGKKPIVLPEGVEAEIKPDQAVIKGPKGTLTLKLHPLVKLIKEDKTLKVEVVHPEVKKERSLWGLFGSLLKNMVEGVTKGFEEKLEMSGIGFKAELKGQKLILSIGFSHTVDFAIPEGIEASVDKEIITIKGIDKILVGEIAARLRALKKTEPYKGKGIKYVGEIIRRKAGKAAVKTAA